MSIPTSYVYLISLIPLVLIWCVLFWANKKTRREMLIMSFILGVFSLMTLYYWFTKDWWLPKNITGTRIGIEDFIIGFTSGGIMAVVYEVFFKKSYTSRKFKVLNSSVLAILLFLSQTTGWLFWGVGITSFYASSIGMLLVASIIFYLRKDLLINGILSGILMAIISLSFYCTIILISPSWIDATYKFDYLSGMKIIGIPIEELIFWFLAGLVWGPFYEYWQNERLVKRI